MKNMKKIVALLVAVLMLMSSVAALAADPAPATPTNNQTLDTPISISGLDPNDKVEFFKVLEFDTDAVTTGGWKAAAGFNDTTSGLTETEIKAILGIDATGKQTADRSAYNLDATIAGKIGDLAESAAVKYSGDNVTYNGNTVGGVTASVADPEAGLYIAIIHPGQAGTIYNPVFVGADYQTNDPESKTFAVVEGVDSYYHVSGSNAGVAKKKKIELDKSITDQTNNNDQKVNTVNVGDTVSFLVKTTIPEFADNYTNPVFKLTDQLTKGLDLQTSTIHVYKGTTKDDATDGNLLASADSYVAGKAYKLTTTDTSYASTALPADSNVADGDSYVVSFFPEFLKAMDAAQPIIITYDAVVLDIAVTSVNIEDNTVTLNFSNNPTDSTGHGILKDETKNYTFDIDADLFGEKTYHASEVVKVGLDKDGKEILQKKQLANGHSIGALQGAEFALYKVNSEGDTTIKVGSVDTKVSAYTNTAMGNNYKIVSDADGRLTVDGATTHGIRGLDAGVYYLVETKAPDGYIKEQNPVKIEIKTTIESVEHTQYYDSATGELYNAQNAQGTLTKVKWTVETLASYSVEINGKETAKYTMTNEEKPDEGDKDNPANTAIGEHGDIGAGDTPDPDADAGKIINTRGMELPSTGGMGTTILYIGGSILVILAAVLLITKRRMNAED